MLTLAPLNTTVANNLSLILIGPTHTQYATGGVSFFSAVINEGLHGYAVGLLATLVRLGGSHEVVLFRRVGVIGRFCRAEQFSALGSPGLPSFGIEPAGSFLSQRRARVAGALRLESRKLLECCVAHFCSELVV